MKNRALALLLLFYLAANQLCAQSDRPTCAEMDQMFRKEWNKPQYYAANTAAGILYLTDNEKDLFYYLNLARMNPPLFANTYAKAYEGKIGHMKGYAFDKRKKSLINNLQKLAPLEILYPDTTLFQHAFCFANLSGALGSFGHQRPDASACVTPFPECCAYESTEALYIILDMLIDWGEGNEMLGHRRTCLAPLGRMGVSIQPHSTAGWIAVLQFGYSPDVEYNTESYSGNLSLDGKRNGTGIYFFENGDMYSGNWVDNKMEGFGTYEYAKGGRYVGEWRNSEMQGRGTYYYPDGTIYDGLWENSKQME